MAETNRGELAWQRELVYEAVQPTPPLDTAWPGTVYGVDHSEVSILALYRKWHELMRG